MSAPLPDPTLRRPLLARGCAPIPRSPFGPLDDALRSLHRADVAALHQGRTTFPPATEMVTTEPPFDLRDHEHAPPAGSRQLRRSIAARTSASRGRATTPDAVLVTAGATHAIGLAVRAVTDPGDDVMLLSPQWLFAAGIVRAARCRPVEVPVFLELAAGRPLDLEAVLTEHHTERCRAIYVNSPNNPTGAVLDEDAVDRLVAFARRHGLWLIVDHAYESFRFGADAPDIAVAGEDLAFSVHTFSKTYAMPGHRIGYVIVPEPARQLMERLALHTGYAVSSASQRAADAVLGLDDSLLAERRSEVRRLWDLVTADLAVPHTAARGGLYTFLDLRETGGADRFVETCLGHGVSLAPGAAFGASGAGWARLCFTAVGEELLLDAVARVNRAYRGLAP